MPLTRSRPGSSGPHAPVFTLARVIRKHKDEMLVWVKERLTNGMAEGIGNRLRMIARRAVGFHCAEGLIAMVLLCLGVVQSHSTLPAPTH